MNSYIKPSKNLWWVGAYFIFETILVILSLTALNGIYSIAVWYEISSYVLLAILPLCHAMLYGPHITWPLGAALQTFLTVLAWKLLSPDKLGTFASFGVVIILTLVALVFNWLGELVGRLRKRILASQTHGSTFLIPSKSTIITAVLFLALWFLPYLHSFLPSTDGIGMSIVMFVGWIIISFLLPYFDAYVFGANLLWAGVYLIALLIAGFTFGMGFGYFLIFAPVMAVGLVIGHVLHTISKRNERSAVQSSSSSL